FDLQQALKHAQKLHAGNPRVSQDAALLEKVWSFLLGRLEVQLRDRAQPDSIQAVLHTGARDVVAIEKRLAALQTVREKSRGQFEATAAAFKRIANILAQAAQKGIAAVGLKPDLARSPAAQALLAALDRSRE